MKTITLYGFVLLAILAAACGPSDADILSTADAARTEAVSTVHAQYTEWALLTPSATNTLIPSNTPAATNTLAVASATATTAPAAANPTTDTCNVMTFLEDVTVPDGTQLSPGESFTKTWRVQNDGSCAWTTTYYLAFDSGDQMDGPDTQVLTAEVAPGASVEISLNLVAPATAGSYESYWVLYSESGAVVGVVYLEIEVA